MSRPSLLSDLVDLHAVLRADRATDPSEKKPRDRRIGRALQGERGRPAAQLRGWLARVELPDWRRQGRAAAQLHHALGLVLAVLGLVSGWALARAVLHYTGAAPINIVNVLAVLILPQLVLLIVWGLAAASVRLPGFGSLREALGFLNPGRVARCLAGRLPTEGARSLELIWDPDNAVALAPAARWLVSLWSQLFAFGFNLGALLALIYLVAFSDLAFGWSTTLALDAATFHAFVSVIAGPWQAWLPEAMPSAELVEASRYYRLETGGYRGGVEHAARLGDWWPFLFATLVTYGLLPRLFTLLFSVYRVRHHLQAALTRLSGAPEVLARMNSPLVSTAAVRAEPAPESNEEPDTGSATLAPAPRLAAPEHSVAPHIRCSLVAWSGSIAAPEAVAEGLAALGIAPVNDLLHAGGAQSTAEDTATIARLCRTREEGVAIVVKAWEPPLLEFVDFARQARRRCARGQPIMVLLWASGEPVSSTDAEVWRLTLRPLADPDLHVETLP